MCFISSDNGRLSFYTGLDIFHRIFGLATGFKEIVKKKLTDIEFWFSWILKFYFGFHRYWIGLIVLINQLLVQKYSGPGALSMRSMPYLLSMVIT